MITEASVNYGIMFKDICPEEIKDWCAGKIKEGVFYPAENVARYFFLKQREYNELEKKSKKINVYVVQTEIGGFVKIGKTTNVEKRIKNIQANCPFRLKTIKVYKDVRSGFERELHKKYMDYRLNGEWFDEEILNQERV